jgi:hypothetical protein
LDRRLSGPQSWAGCGGEEKNSQPLPGLETPIIQLVAQHITMKLTVIVVMIFYFLNFRNAFSPNFVTQHADEPVFDFARQVCERQQDPL